MRIVIIGAGFGGAYTAKYLHKILGKEHRIEIINRENYFVFQPLLPEVASGVINIQDAVTPIRLMLKDIDVRSAEVIDIDKGKQCVYAAQGIDSRLIEIPFDHLVIATGLKPELSRLPGFTEHALTMKNLSDAYLLRNHIIECLEESDSDKNEQTVARNLCFVVGGGGFSGVETIGELQEMIHRTLRFYPHIDKERIRMILVHSGDRILPEMGVKLSEYVKQKLEARGIEIITNTMLTGMTGDAVELDNGEIISCRTVVSTVGNSLPKMVQNLDFPTERGRLSVDDKLRIVGCSNIWALGDVALIPNTVDEFNPCPPTAQFAVQQAHLLASNIAAEIHNLPLTGFSYKPRGSLASIGDYRGVAEIKSFRISGFIAWTLWRAVYLAMFPSAVSRLRIALNWLFDYFIPRNIVHVQQHLPPSTCFMRFKAGDVVADKNQILRGLYTVVRGRLQLEVLEEDGKLFKREILPGDHFGERTIEKDILTTGRLIALEESYLMFIKRSDFAKLRDYLPGFGKYISSLGAVASRYSKSTDTKLARRMPGMRARR